MDHDEGHPIQDDASDEVLFAFLLRLSVHLLQRRLLRILLSVEEDRARQTLQVDPLRRLLQQHRSLLAIRSSARLCSRSVRHRTRPYRLPRNRWLSVAFVPGRLLSRSPSLFLNRSSPNRCRSRFLLRPHRFPGRLFFTLRPRCISIRPHSTCRANCRAPIRPAATDVAGSMTLAVRIRTGITFAPPATVMAGVVDCGSDCSGPAVKKHCCLQSLFFSVELAV